MYLFVNPDDSVNYAGDHPINPDLHIDGLTLIERPDKTLRDMVGDIPPEAAMWDKRQQKIVCHPAFVVGSELWRQGQANRRINQYYPLYKQLNILRSGNKEAVKKMTRFIDTCRKWSNDTSIDSTAIRRVTP